VNFSGVETIELDCVACATPPVSPPAMRLTRVVRQPAVNPIALDHVVARRPKTTRRIDEDIAANAAPDQSPAVATPVDPDRAPQRLVAKRARGIDAAIANDDAGALRPRARRVAATRGDRQDAHEAAFADFD
jgi:hypothetical protein